ncbi:hypothetical protein HII31_05206 [Pseudocercospora fuligena]|uniref:Uncharacterized protein n=1 Tax=Pseudocercospora fuligena TaxID=685502 RepID=A0A8H6RJ69_9PEZI|nr:hypothetical protein HII31_05206 [Pseudocercospora fuligena]
MGIDHAPNRAGQRPTQCSHRLEHSCSYRLPIWRSSRHTRPGVLARFHLLLLRHGNSLRTHLHTESGARCEKLLFQTIRRPVGWRHVWRADVVCSYLDPLLWLVQSLKRSALRARRSASWSCRRQYNDRCKLRCTYTGLIIAITMSTSAPNNTDSGPPSY